MRLALYVLGSGHLLPTGLVLVVAGAIGRFRWPRVGLPVALVGLLLALVSAVPVDRRLYGVLIAAFGLWCAIGPHRPRAGRVAVALLLTACALVQWSGTLPPRPGVPGALPVFVLGDSLSAGLGSGIRTWPDILAERTGREITNLAHPGSRLRDGFRQAERLPPGASLVIVELGGNDVLGGADADEFRRDLTDLLGAVAHPGRTIAMFELPLLPLQNGFGEAQREVSSTLGVALIPRRVLAGAVAFPGHTIDGLHLSAEGHRWLATEVAAWLQPGGADPTGHRG